MKGERSIYILFNSILHLSPSDKIHSEMYLNNFFCAAGRALRDDSQRYRWSATGYTAQHLPAAGGIDERLHIQQAADPVFEAHADGAVSYPVASNLVPTQTAAVLPHSQTDALLSHPTHSNLPDSETHPSLYGF